MSWQNIKKIYLGLFLLIDYGSSIFVFYLFAKVQNYSGDPFWQQASFKDHKTLLFVEIPLLFIFLHILYNSYANVLRQSRFDQLQKTFKVAVVGSIVLYFLILSKIHISENPLLQVFWLSLLFLIGNFTPRYLLVEHLIQSFKKKKLQLPTLLLFPPEDTEKIEKILDYEREVLGNHIIGYLAQTPLEKDFSFEYLGNEKDLSKIILQKDIQEIILFNKADLKKDFLEILATLVSFPYINLRIVSADPQLLLPYSDLGNIHGHPWQSIHTQPWQTWQKILKRAFDLVAAFLGLLLSSPIFLFLMVWIPWDSKGPVFFKQERIGYLGKPFFILKFRTMFVDAEAKGPQLSSKNDPRITKIGRFLRKTRLDELPQLLNVLKGEMSLVGPRPERQFFIEQLQKRIPYYALLHNFTPGITSLGQVRYGYAENTEQMIERFQYDLIYAQNPSLILDIKILLYTIQVILKAKGK